MCGIEKPSFHEWYFQVAVASVVSRLSQEEPGICSSGSSRVRSRIHANACIRFSWHECYHRIVGMADTLLPAATTRDAFPIRINHYHAISFQLRVTAVIPVGEK